ARTHGQTRGVGESKVFVEAALQRGGEMRVTVDQPGEERFAAAFVDLGVRVGPENRVGRTDGGDRVADHGQRDVVLDGVDGDDGRAREHTRSAGRRLRFAVAPIEKQRGRAGAGAREQFAPSQVRRWHSAYYAPNAHCDDASRRGRMYRRPDGTVRSAASGGNAP